jgi:hypothetical protein
MVESTFAVLSPEGGFLMPAEGTHKEGGRGHLTDGYLHGWGYDSMGRSPESTDSGEIEGYVFLMSLVEVFAQVRAAVHLPWNEIVSPQVPPEVIG